MGERAPAHPRTRWVGLGFATLSALLLATFWAGILYFARHGLDLGYATMVAFALLLGLATLVHLAATAAAILALFLRARPLAWSLAVAAANVASMGVLLWFR